MSRGLSAVVSSICFLVSITASAQSRGQSATATHGIVLEINIVETTGAQRSEIEKMETGRDQLSRLIADGKARLFASLQVRTRAGESFSARVGQRVPIQTAPLPALRTTDRNAREPVQPQATPAVVPQIAYENTGVIVEGVSTAVGDRLLDIRLKIEMTSVDHTTGSLTPTFTQRTLTDLVRMKESATALLMGFTQPEGRRLSIEEIASGTTSTVRGGFVVLLTTKAIK